MTHTCNLPEERPFYEAAQEAEDWRAEYWRCLKCGQTWHIYEDYCYECGRSDGPEWTKVAGTVFIGPYEEPLPGSRITLPDISVQRGGLRYGERHSEPPVPVIIGRPSDHRDLLALRARIAEAEKRVIGIDEGMVMSAGWCAPTEVTHEI